MKQVPTAKGDQQTTECVFWDFALRGGIGDWSTKGCSKRPPIAGRTVCHCDHATNFAILVVSVWEGHLKTFKVSWLSTMSRKKIGFYKNVLFCLI